MMQTSSTTTSMEEDAQKRNTDCVYYLASPLTCKKGSECEYRHSETARVNPRDCRYWFSGTCLKPHCPFRHPPLEGRQTNSTPAISGVPIKNKALCYFFFQGYCAKGDKCSFQHVYPIGGSTGTSGTQNTPKITDQGREVQLSEKKTSSTTVSVSKKPSATLLMTFEAQNAKLPASGCSPVDSNPQNHALGKQLCEPKCITDNVHETSINMNHVLNSQISELEHRDEWIMKNAEVEEWVESPPGFDVLVDDGLEHCHNEDVDYHFNHEMQQVHDQNHGHEMIIPATDDDVLQIVYDSSDLQYFDGMSCSNQSYREYDEKPNEYDESLDGYVPQDNVDSHKRKASHHNCNNGRKLRNRKGTTIEKYSGRDTLDLRHKLIKLRESENLAMDNEATRMTQVNPRKFHIEPNNLSKHSEERFYDTKMKHRYTGRSRMSQPKVIARNAQLPFKLFHQRGSVFQGDWDKVHNQNLRRRDIVNEDFKITHTGNKKDRNQVNLSLPPKAHFRKFGNRFGSNDSVDFAKPKTLEQIKEEKRKADFQGSICNDSDLGFGTAKEDSNHVFITNSNKALSFEGPKPLTAILKNRKKSSFFEVNGKSADIHTEEDNIEHT